MKSKWGDFVQALSTGTLFEGLVISHIISLITGFRVRVRAYEVSRVGNSNPRKGFLAKRL